MVDVAVLEALVLLAELLGEDRVQGVLAYELAVDQQLAELLARRRLCREASVELLAGDHSALEEQRLETSQPVLVVAVAQVIDRMLTLTGVTALIGVPAPERAAQDGER